MSQLHSHKFFLALTVVLILLGSGNVTSQEKVDYLTAIKPLLKAHCYACHGGLKQEAGLRLDTVALMKKGGDSGSVISEKEVAKSLILQRIATKDLFERMPPENEGEAFSDKEIELIKLWISQGAHGPQNEVQEADPRSHWAFQTVVRPQVPQVKNEAWVKNPIDVFLAKQHEDHGLTPQTEEQRIVLLRRLYFDLLGVPPTEEEIIAFETDTSPDYYEKTVKRLLADPRYGERWGRHWMDIWRYSDWWGLGNQLRNSQKHIWHWRDWIIESLNQDMHYDEMIRLMLAADELHPKDLNKIRATGYLARNFFIFNRNGWMDETVEHLSKGFLGITMNCAKCHDHKFDPISQSDYYKLRAFFEPYYVRTDMVPGETDLAVDGIPRAYDGLLDTPTYRYERGNDKQPDKSKVMTPGVPELLAFKELDIKPIDLPVESYQPERQPWVLDAYLTKSEKKIADQKKAVEQAKSVLTKAIEKAKQLEEQEQKKTPPPKNPSTDYLVEDDFEKLDPKVWKLIDGQWDHKPGYLEQKMDGAQRSTLRLLKEVPKDFDATVRFTILGGSRWRSVSLIYDASEATAGVAEGPQDYEQNVYVSAVAKGSKVQASYLANGKREYPADGRTNLKVELNKEYTFHVQVRDNLVNANLNGEPVLAWRSPIARKDGVFKFTTFDALAVFHEVKIKALDPMIELREPAKGNAPQKVMTLQAAKRSVTEAENALKKAESALLMREAEHESVKQRVAALRADWSNADKATKQATHVKAVQGERKLKLLQAEVLLTQAKKKVKAASDDKKEAANTELKKAQEAYDKAKATAEAAVKPEDQFAKFTGAKWSATRFRESRTDDKTIPFPAKSSGRRTALANWIVDRKNPLTARVAVNHIWSRHMGKPLVESTFDFGLNGSQTKHVELLDWLASEFCEHDWSMKYLHELIVTSAAYRMSSSNTTGKNLEIDPDNHLLWRREPIRLESQAIRDAVLSLAKSLDHKMGGPPIPENQQAASKRRSVYFYHSNNSRNLFLMTFDEALVSECYRRDQSIVPQQALALTNSRMILENSKQIAQLLTDPNQDEVDFVRRSFRVILGITPSEKEINLCLQALEAWKKLPKESAETARINLIRSLINHNDFVTVR